MPEHGLAIRFRTDGTGETTPGDGATAIAPDETRADPAPDRPATTTTAARGATRDRPPDRMTTMTDVAHNAFVSRLRARGVDPMLRADLTIHAVDPVPVAVHRHDIGVVRVTREALCVRAIPIPRSPGWRSCPRCSCRPASRSIDAASAWRWTRH